jgi:hypothetical protein
MNEDLNTKHLREDSIEKETTDTTTHNHYCTLRDGSLISSKNLSFFSDEEEL